MKDKQCAPWERSSPFDYNALNEAISNLPLDAPFLGVGSLGCSILGRSIPLLTLGSGTRHLLYVGAHHGMEWITSAILMHFVSEFCDYATKEKGVYRLSLSSFCDTYTVSVVPMLNPDGVEYQIHGVDESNPLYERVWKMNGASSDFSHWQANARGVDLNHNYDAGFAEYKSLEAENGIDAGAPTRYSGEHPESENEVAYLCNFIRFHETLKGVLTLHTQGEEIFYKSGGYAPRGAERVAKRIASLTGYRPSNAEGLASFGGLTDWCVQRLDLPSFTLECGKGINPLPMSDCFPIYTRLREMLYTLPIFL